MPLIAVYQDTNNNVRELGVWSNEVDQCVSDKFKYYTKYECKRSRRRKK